jgi:methionine synthase II (cobalamin-independent)
MKLKTDALPTLIGSFPHKDHFEATNLVLKYTPEFPLWVQLPCYPYERLLTQASENMPGVFIKGNDPFFDIEHPLFEQAQLEFYALYLDVMEGKKRLHNSKIAFSKETGKGFFSLLNAIPKTEIDLKAIKGQVTGPFTLATALKNTEGKIAMYFPQMWDIIIKSATLRALYQVEEFNKIHPDTIIFLDEPGLAGFGSSTLIGVSKEEITAALTEIIDAIHSKDALAGIHVCANTDWSLIFSTPVDILSFDSYEFFDKLILYKDLLEEFLKRGGIIAWGIVPTLNKDILAKETIETLYEKWTDQIKQINLPEEIIKEQSLITPSCGMGLLSVEESVRALQLTRGVSARIREN